MNKRGITLIALTITIVILIILVGVGGTVSVRLIRKGKEQSLASDMLQIQAKVKIIMERVAFNGDTSIYIGTKLKDAENKAEIAGSALTTQELEKDSIYIYDKDTLASIGLDSIKLSSQEVFLVDYSNADIIFPKGCKREDGSTFYRLSEIYNNNQTYTENSIPVVAFKAGANTIKIEVFVQSEVTEYQFKIGTTRDSAKQAEGVWQAQNTYAFEGLENNKIYYIIVKIKLATGAEYESHTYKVKTKSQGEAEGPIDPEILVTGVSLNKTSTTINKGGAETLIAAIVPSNATNKNVSWSSNNNAVATVDSAGKVTAVEKGTAIITVTTADGGYTASCTVTVNVPVTGISLNKTSTTLNKGGEETLIATIAPSDAINTNVSWSSNNESVATVDSTGKVTAVAKGTAVITVTTQDGGYTASCTVTVNVPVTGVSLNKTSTALNKGETETLIATIAPSDASNTNVTWSSNNTGVATVNNGQVTAVAGGTATITVTTEDGSYTASCTVTVNVPVAGVSLNKASTTINKRNTENLIATITPSDATNQNITWSSNNTGVATVNNGQVTAVAKGTATITATTEDGGYTASCTVTVNVPVTGVSLNKTSTSINKGETENLIATITPSDAINQNVSWSSNNNTVATVDNTGKVTAVAEGTATITVTTEDGSYTASCIVTVKIPVTGVSLNKTSTTINKGNTETLIATIAPGNATNTNVTWSSSNTGVATVTNGQVTAVARGTATITVTTEDGSHTASCTVTVNVPVTGVSLNKTSIPVRKGGKVKLTATITPIDASNTNKTWSSSDTGVATVQSNGQVTGVATGTATITVTTADGGYTASCTVNVQ